HSFIVGAIMMWASSAIVWVFLILRHQEMATEGPEPVIAH
ncbi:MAG: hypothetical protein JWR42_1548, partial [Marmoricola sp.]|nr:hypothetical protein [Marmoricola sp.]